MRYLLSTRSFSFLLIKHYFQRKHPIVEKEMCKSTSRLSETQNQCSHNTYHFFEAFEKESSWQIIRFYLWLPMGHCSSSSNPFQNPPFAYLRTYQLSLLIQEEHPFPAVIIAVRLLSATIQLKRILATLLLTLKNNCTYFSGNFW